MGRQRNFKYSYYADLMSSISLDVWRPLTFQLASAPDSSDFQKSDLNDLTVHWEIGSRCAYATLIGDFKSTCQPPLLLVGWLATLMPPCSIPKMTASLRPSALIITADGRLIRAGGREVRWCLWLVQFTKLCLLETMLGTMTETCFERKNVTGTNRNDYTNKSLKGEAKCRWLSSLNVASRSPD